MNMYRCKTEVDFFVGNNGRDRCEDFISRPSKTNSAKEKKQVTRPRRPKSHLPVTRRSSVLVR